MPKTNYPQILQQLSALVDGIPYEVANLANASALLWQELEKGADTAEALAKVLTDTYEVEEDEAIRDVNGFLDYLKELGVMEA